MLKNHTTESVTNAMTKNFEKAKSHHEENARRLNKEADSLVEDKKALTERILKLDEEAKEQEYQAENAGNAIEAIQNWATTPIAA